MVEKKKALRRCCICMQHFEKTELLRVLKTPEGDVVLDKSLKKNGRGAYVCKNAACLQKARKSRRLETSLKCAVGEDVYLALEKMANEG
ncbi:MAG: YlxR family protein [Clostridia bacterium]|nr:YlxR family protein [Clostridia bacterium]